MKVAFTGPSGSGKTTLVQFVKDNPQWDLPWLNGSSGQLKTEEENKELQKDGLTVGHGHLRVIQSGHLHPKAAIENQYKILYGRTKILQFNPRLVTDRSPVDNWVYYLLQCSMYENDEASWKFFKACCDAVQELTHVIFIPTMFKVEDNGSRIPNFYFQTMVSTIFEKAIQDMQGIGNGLGWKTKFLIIDSPDLSYRKRVITDFLNG